MNTPPTTIRATRTPAPWRASPRSTQTPSCRKSADERAKLKRRRRQPMSRGFIPGALPPERARLSRRCAQQFGGMGGGPSRKAVAATSPDDHIEWTGSSTVRASLRFHAAHGVHVGGSARPAAARRWRHVASVGLQRFASSRCSGRALGGRCSGRAARVAAPPQTPPRRWAGSATSCAASAPTNVGCVCVCVPCPCPMCVSITCGVPTAIGYGGERRPRETRHTRA